MPVLTGSNISADGTYTITTFPGERYVLAASGDFGGGSLAFNWVEEGVSSPYAGSPATDEKTFSFTAASTTAEFVLTGATAPDIEVLVTLARGGGDLTSGPVTSTGGTSSIADGALSIAKTAGLQAALDGINPSSIPGMVAGYRVEDTTRTGSLVDVWRDISGHGRHATADGTKDTVYGTAPNEYAAGGIRYSPAVAIPATLEGNMTMVCIFGARRVPSGNTIANATFALTDPAGSGGGGLCESGTVQFYNPTRTVGCVRNSAGMNSVAFRFGAGQTSVRSNGITSTAAANGTVSTPTFINIWGYAGAGTFVWQAERVALYFYNRVLSDAEITGIEKWHGVATPTSALHILGDSFVAGTGASTAALSYASILEAGSGMAMVAVGGSGMRVSSVVVANFAKSVQVSKTAGLDTIVVLDIGKNDLAANTSSASLQALYSTLIAAITATGASTVVVSMPPRTAGFSGGADAASYETQRLNFNAWLRTQEGTLFAKLADTGADANLGDVADLAGSYYTGDGIHLSATGHAAWAAIVLAEVNSL